MLLVSNEFKYPAKHKLVGAAKIVIVGIAGSGIPFTTKILLRITGSNTAKETKANQNIILPNACIPTAPDETLATAIPT